MAAILAQKGGGGGDACGTSARSLVMLCNMVLESQCLEMVVDKLQ